MAFHDIWHDFQHSVSHLDKGIFYNFRTILNPKLILEYIAGKRIRFYNPILYALLSMGLLAYLEKEFYIKQGAAPASLSTDKIYELGFEIGVLISHYARYMKLVIIFPLALFASIFFRRSHGFRYIENFYIYSFIAANAAIIDIILFPVTRHFESLIINRVIAFTLVLFFTWIVYTRNNPATAFFRTVLVMLFSYIVAMLFFVLLAFIVMELRGS